MPGKVGVLLIRFYQLVISPMFPACCRYTPTCSEYGLQAVRRYGLVKGSWLALKRILRCRPGGDVGYDPVPEQFTWLARSKGH
ncbi:MAG: membrane protein insertion efficiency factor YidD [Coriobacteriia bacterium]|nr:membrane protein insertion efficiency factor YidD [Coriobacteriia bacterium]